MEQLTSLNRRRGGIKSQITKLFKFIADDIEKSDIVEISNKLEMVGKLENKLEDLQLEYYNTLKEDDLEKSEAELDEINEDIQKLKVSLKRFINNKNESSDILSSNHNSNNKVNIKLPEIPLPKFDGSYQNWAMFKNQFNSIIHLNTNLTCDQKLFYLQSALIGNAKQIQSLDDNYDSLFLALQNRYENKRLIVNSHFRSLLSLDIIPVESAEKLRTLVDSVLKDVRALKVMNIEMNIFGENLLINIICQKLDKITLKEFEKIQTAELPNWQNFISFLQERCIMLENIQRNPTFLLSKTQNKVKNFNLNTNKNACKMCKKSHPLYSCESFLKLNPIQRFELVKKKGLCLNCFSNEHFVSNCKAKYLCKGCSSKHNYLLCRDTKAMNEGGGNPVSSSANAVNLTEKCSQSINNETFIPNDCATSQNLSCLMTEKKNVILATAIIYIKNKYGNFFKARAILDSGSQINVISSQLAHKLQLKEQKVNTLVHSLTGKEICIKKETNAVISNFDNSFSTKINLLIVPKVTDALPAEQLDISEINFPKNVCLADPYFFKPGNIDILLGNEIFFNVIKNKLIYLSNSLILKESVFGYIVAGSVRTNQNTMICGFLSKADELHENVKRFWEFENLEDSPSFKDDEIKCENYYLETVKRDKNSGKYMVSLPLREELNLGDSYMVAKTRLESLWKKLDRNVEMKELYVNFMNEYLQLGHMREITDLDSVKYLMPHHGVYRADNKTTRLRVVFNGSAPTSNGISLNNCLYKGGIVQDELFSILLRFRKHKIAFVADIKKMYRQILVNPDQCPLQCILWKSSSVERIKIFQLLTITYGTSCAPFLATRTIKQLALDEKEQFPLASAAALSDIYVDDILTGANDQESAFQLQSQLIDMFRSACMELHKWCSNDKNLLYRVSPNSNEYDFEKAENNSIKTLGLRWNPAEDTFYFEVSDCLDTPTKRSVLSEIARLYDPLGILGPVVIQAKVFLQQLWKLKLEWSQELPLQERKNWEKFRKKLLEIKKVKVQRFVLLDNVSVVELHGFSDAAKEAYGAAIYLRCIDSSGEIRVRLLCSKTRVSPIKEITIPRLELCGAVLLSRLSKKVINSLQISITKIYLWTDSRIVLAWIAKPLSQLKLFVKNRVSIIQEFTDIKCWNHIGSKDNPADLLSRGLDADKIANCELWWFGPSFLHQNIEFDLETENCQLQLIENSDTFVKELKEPSETVCIFTKNLGTFDLINNCSSFSKLQRITAWCLRFITNARNPKHKIDGCLKTEELFKSLTILVKIVQSTAFSDELQCLQKNKPIRASSPLLTLSPYIDSNGVIRVGGRLKNANLDINQRNPILLPNNHNFTYIVIIHYHILHFHLGPEGTLSVIRSRFWITRARNIIRKILKGCITCLKVSARPSHQLMADLPSVRVIPSRIFSKVGLDFAGPFSIKTFSGRAKKIHKCYVCIFVCLVVKAVHIELVHNLTTDAFLAALKRFIARRNRPSEIFSDNATNFIGANNELRKIVKDLYKTSSKDKIEDYSSSEGIKWSFNPPLAPNFGGLWEASVKSLKQHLKRIVGDTILSYDEFLTFITQIEAILNSRPLCPLSNDLNDIAAITPAHFVVGSSLVALQSFFFLVGEGEGGALT